MNKKRFRFAPSPTGYIHLANIRIAILNYIKAKQDDGDFILRIDDTDTERSKQEYIDQILEDLQWMNIKHDEIYFQSKRFDEVYKNVIENLKENKVLYPAYETTEELDNLRQSLLKRKLPPKYTPIATEEQKLTRKPHWRFKLPEANISWNDEFYGMQTAKQELISDPVVIREDGSLTYILASVIDDYFMKITNIIRGRDHISNTNTQLLMLKTIDELYNTKTVINFSHFPLISSVNGQKFSKREGGFAVKDFRESSIQPHIISRFLLTLGSNQLLEYNFNINEDYKDINWNKYGKADIKCDPEQIKADNKYYISSMSPSEAIETIAKNIKMENWENFWKLIRSDVSNQDDIFEWEKILYSNQKYDLNTDERELLIKISELIKGKEVVDKDSLKEIQKALEIDQKTLNKLLRKVLTGKEKGPKIFEIIEFLGKKKVLEKLNQYST